MQFYGQAESAANRILEAFKAGRIPAALATVFIRRGDGLPCRAWSWSNQLLVALHGFDDARGFRQWEQAGRHVRKGEHAFFILGPVTRRIRTRDEQSGDEAERLAVVGFKAIPVFGYEQTDGRPLERDGRYDGFLDGLPVVSVARAWGLKVSTYSGRDGAALGWYRPGQAIALGVENLATWAHELIHAADDRRGALKRNDKIAAEVVAELGGAILLCALGREADADLGGAWRYIDSWSSRSGLAPVVWCERLLKRTCEAVALILQTAADTSAATVETAAASGSGVAA